jgi:hypothetical protein
VASRNHLPSPSRSKRPGAIGRLGTVRPSPAATPRVTSSRYTVTRSDAVTARFRRPDFEKAVVEEETDCTRLLIGVRACSPFVAPFGEGAEVVLADVNRVKCKGMPCPPLTHNRVRHRAA